MCMHVNKQLCHMRTPLIVGWASNVVRDSASFSLLDVAVSAKALVYFRALVALKLLVSLISRLVACSARCKKTDRPSTVTLAAHAPQGLITQPYKRILAQRRQPLSCHNPIGNVRMCSISGLSRSQYILQSLIHRLVLAARQNSVLKIGGQNTIVPENALTQHKIVCWDIQSGGV